MQALSIRPSGLTGSLTVPSSKSHTLRAILFALMAKGTSVIENYLDSPDTDAMIAAATAFGAAIEKTPDKLIIQGVAASLQAPDNVIDAGNSGIVLRFISALATLAPAYSVITGDDSIRNKRPVKPLIQGLRGLGAFIESLRGDGRAPLIVKGPLRPGRTVLDGEDSQPVSALLIAASFLKGHSVIEVINPGEKPWIDLTLHWLRRLGIGFEKDGYERYVIKGNASYGGFQYHVPADFSTAAFPIAAALVTGSEIKIENIDKNDIQGDKKLIDILLSMGAKISWEKDKKLTVHKSPPLQGKSIDINDCIDALPILATLSCFAIGQTIITGAAIARKKESDRIHAIATELNKMGARVEELEEGLIIHPAPLKGAEVYSHKDHRIALSLAIAGLAAEGTTCIQEVECINKTYKNYVKDFQTLGCKIDYL